MYPLKVVRRNDRTHRALWIHGYFACQGCQAMSVTKAGLLRTVTHPIRNALHLFQELRDECVVDTGLDKQACSRDTGLARSDEGGKSCPIYCRRNVGIVEYYDWGLTHQSVSGTWFATLTGLPSRQVQQ